MKPVPRRLLFLAATWSLLACRPTPAQPDLGQVGDPAPPKAPVLATLTEAGPLQGDARGGTDVEPLGSVVGVSPKRFGSTSEPIYLTFSTAMDSARSQLDFDIEPSIPGTTTWTSPTRVAFQPTHSLHNANLYKVSVTGQAKTRGGQSLEVDERWSFETPRPTARLTADPGRYREAGRDRVRWDAGFTVALSDDAGERAVRDALSVEHVDGKRVRPLPFRLEPLYPVSEQKTATVWRVLPKSHWPADATVRATLAGSLTTVRGTLPTGKEAFSTLRTRAGFKASVQCDDSATDGCVTGDFQLQFDTPLPKSALRKIRVSPQPKHFDPHPYLYGDEESFSTMVFYGDFEAGRTYTVRLGKGIRDTTGQVLAGKSSRSVTFVAPPPILELRGTGTQLTGRRGTFGVESRSIEDARLSISTLSNAALAEIVYAEDDVRALPKHGVKTRELDLDLTPGGAWGWDAREFSLAKVLGSPKGAAFVELFPGTIRPDQKHRAPVETSRELVQFTNLGLLVGDSPAGGFVRVLTLDAATPVSGATAHIFAPSSSPPKLVDSFGPSDAEGFIRVPAPTRLANHAVVVETDDDRVALGLEGEGRGSWRSHHLPARGAEFDVGVIMTDRGIYQPGERMRVMGWVARSSTEHAESITAAGTRPVVVKLSGPGGDVLAESTVRTKAYGKFWATLDIPSTAKLGHAQIHANVEGDGGGSFSRGVRLREFVAPAYDVSLSLKDTELQHGEGTHVSAVARYLHGMPLPVAEASLQTRCSPTSYRPLNTTGFSILTAVTLASSPTTGWSSLKKTAQHAKGRVDADMEFPGLSPGHPYRCRVTLLTMDSARQELSTTASAWVHPSRYLLVRQADKDPQVGSAWTTEVRAVLPSGEPTTAKPAKLRFTREHNNGRSETLHTCTLKFDDRGSGTCTWTPRKPGRYNTVLIGGVDGVKVSHHDSVWVLGRPGPKSEDIDFSVSAPEQSTVGEAVDIAVQTHLPRATGVVVEVHAGIRTTHPFTTQDHAAQLRLTANESWVPNGYLDTLVAHPDGKRLPYLEYSFDTVELGYGSRELTVTVQNPTVASAGSTLPIDVTVADPKGRPVTDAHVSVWAVDEGILMLRDWSFPSFTHALAIDRGNEARYFNGYRDLRTPYTLRRDPFESGLRGVGSGGGAGGSGFGSGAGMGGGGAGSSPKTRRNFDPAPIFIGDVKTGSDGTARVHGVLPDNLTTFRIAAVATAEVPGTGAFARAGREESKVRVTQDLAVRPLLPRVLRPGDTAELGVLVDNLTDTPGTLEVKVALKDAAGLARITSPGTITRRLDGAQARIPVSVEAQGPGELLVWVSATLTTDDGHVLQDASELPLEVRAERTLIRHAATYGSMLDVQTSAVALEVPGTHIPDSASASVDVYASMLGGYKDTANDLVTYPYGCVEQTSSRLVPLAALHELEGFDLGVGSVTEFAQAGLDRLESMQTASGGFGYWPGSSHAHVYGTAYAAWVLGELKRSGIQIDEDVLERALSFLETELARVRSYATPSAHDDARAAMALLAIASSGRVQPEVLEGLLSRADALPVFSRALLAMAVHTGDPNDPRLPALLDSLRERVEVRDTTARSKAASRRFTALFDSPVRTDAMILLALVRAAPDDALIEPLARGLTKARNSGQLRNTQENAYALLAMAGYAELRESVEPDMDVRAWVGTSMVVDASFNGRDLTLVQESAAITTEDPLVTLERLGQGRMYYRVGMQWAPKPETIEPRARGISIQRTLFDSRGALDDRSLVAGEGGTLEVVITADARQRYVAIDVPLPAGLEAVDRSLGRGGASKTVRTSTGGRSLPYSHHELRGDRVLVFVDQLPAGTYRYRVPVRATHEGHYSMPPATVHAMYSPEVSGNTGGRPVRVVSP
ncbi:MAG: alpha-2-macroglobulin family protein [Nannocystales bacterium]